MLIPNDLQLVVDRGCVSWGPNVRKSIIGSVYQSIQCWSPAVLGILIPPLDLLPFSALHWHYNTSILYSHIYIYNTHSTILCVLFNGRQVHFRTDTNFFFFAPQGTEEDDRASVASVSSSASFIPYHHCRY